MYGDTAMTKYLTCLEVLGEAWAEDKHDLYTWVMDTCDLLRDKNGVVFIR